jgi:hypothetical protein
MQHLPQFITLELTTDNSPAPHFSPEIVSAVLRALLQMVRPRIARMGADVDRVRRRPAHSSSPIRVIRGLISALARQFPIVPPLQATP